MGKPNLLNNILSKKSRAVAANNEEDDNENKEVDQDQTSESQTEEEVQSDEEEDALPSETTSEDVVEDKGDNSKEDETDDQNGTQAAFAQGYAQATAIVEICQLAGQSLDFARNALSKNMTEADVRKELRALATSAPISGHHTATSSVNVMQAAIAAKTKHMQRR